MKRITKPGVESVTLPEVTISKWATIGLVQ